MNNLEIKKKLIEEIKRVNDVQLLKNIYKMLTTETDEEICQLNEAQISAVEEAREHYKKGETFTNEEVDREIEEAYISKLVTSGEYKNRSEVVNDALKLHEKYRDKAIADLRIDIELGWDGPDSTMTLDEIFDSLKKG